jgi:hypothetical protein
VLDVATAVSSPCVEGVGAADLPGASAEYRRQRLVPKHSVGEFSRSGRHCRMGMERGRFRVDRIGKRELLSSPIGASIGEGDLQNLFEGEELRIMLFNYREMGIIPKVELMYMVPSPCVCNCNLYCNVACWPFSHVCADPAALVGDLCAEYLFGERLRWRILLCLSVLTLGRLSHRASLMKDFD